MKLCKSCKKPLVYIQGAQTLYYSNSGRIEVKHKDRDIIFCENCCRMYDDIDSLKVWKDDLNEQRIRDIKKIIENK